MYSTTSLLQISAAGSLLAITGIGLSLYGAHLWKARTKELIGEVENQRLPMWPETFNAAEIDQLPPVVQQYFRSVLTPNQPMIAAASLTHEGSFNMGENDGPWKKVTSSERVITKRPGFVWSGNIQLAPGLKVRLHEAYVAGVGVEHPSLQGLYSITDRLGDFSTARSELIRFYAEAVWYPTALLPSQGVTWRGIDDHTAMASARDGGISIDLEFVFRDDGLIETVRTPKFGNAPLGTPTVAAWEMHWSDYRVHASMRIPFTGEAYWALPHGHKAYWRGQLKKIDFEFTNTQQH